MNNHIFLAILCFFYIGCQEKKNTSSTVLSLNDQYKNPSFNFIMKKFGLLYPENYRSDSNSLVFYCVRSFDSSFLIHLKQGPNEINGVYYVEMPTYRDNLNDFPMDENHPSYFEGYSFTLDSAKWEVIKRKTEELLSDTSFRNSIGCRDCKEYSLSYNFRSKIDNGIKYAPYYEFLEELFLKNLIQSRKPIMYKGK